MRRHGAPWMGAIALVVLSGCGSDDGGGGGSTPTPPKAQADLRADVNRNGTVDLDDPTEDESEETWDASHGAIFLANIDDDSLRCPKGSSANALSDMELKSCFDAADDVVNGDDDLADMARLRVVAWAEAPDDASAHVTVTRGADSVRLFKNNGGQWAVLPPDGLITVQELRAGVELALEGRDVMRDAAVWDGLVDVTLDVVGGTGAGGKKFEDASDVVELKVAPILLSHHLQKAEEIYATNVFSGGSVAFRAELEQAATAAGVELGMKALKPADPDQWTQDWMEIAYMTMPAPNGEQHEIDVYMRSVNVFTPNNAQSPLRRAGKEVYATFHGKDVAGFTPDFDIKHPGDMDSLNSYGNTETIPPYEHGGKSYPMGRLFRGAVPSFKPDAKMQTMLDAQGVQPTLTVDTSWLLVGHVDETISFVKMSNARGWGMAVNDAAMAKKMLEDLVAQGNGDIPFFVGKKFYDDNFNEVSAEATAKDILANTEVMAESASAVVEVDAQMDVFKTEVGITDADVIPMPFLHYPASGFSLAYQPGTVNGISLSDTHFGAPRTHGPNVGGSDPFAKQLETAMGQHGITVLWVEDWDLYHRLSGEVHCGSNTRRALPTNAKWWEAQP